jgi:hypothetical protein
LLEKFEVISTPSKLSPLNVKPHTSEELDVKRRPIELLKFVDRLFQPIEAPLGILEKVPPVRIRNEVFGLPPSVCAIEAGAFDSNDLWE